MKLIFENWRKTLSEGNLRMAHVKEVYPDKSPGEQSDIFEKYSKCNNVNNVAELRDVISGEITCQGLNEEAETVLTESAAMAAMWMIMAAYLLGRKPKDEREAQEAIKSISDEERRELAKQVAQDAIKDIESKMDYEEFADAGMPDTKPQKNLGWDPSALGEELN